MSDTPRTDAEYFTSYDGSDIDGWKSQPVVPANFARQLERELAEALAALQFYVMSDEENTASLAINRIHVLRKKYEERK